MHSGGRTWECPGASDLCFNPATVCFQEGQGPCQLLPLRAGGMLVLLLLRPHVGVGRTMRAQLADAVAPVLPALAAQVAHEVDSANGWHVKGFRCAHSLHTSWRSDAVKYQDSAVYMAVQLRCCKAALRRIPG